MDGELWSPVKGYENLYEVSNFGRVRSLPRKKTKGGILKQGISRGYAKVTLYKEGKHLQCRVHRLVASAFVMNPLTKPMVNHLDENKLNNRADNLEWCTHVENCNYGTAKQRTRIAQINDPSKSKPVEQYSKCGRFIQAFQSIKEAERQTNISHSSISRCCEKKRRSAGGYTWKFAT